MRGAGMGMAMVLVLWVGGFFSGAAAQQAADSGRKATMGEVVVTAGREKEEVLRVPALVTVITTEDIAATTARNVPEVLAAAGLHVSDIGGNQRTYTVDMRGFGEVAPMNLLVMVDGRRINQPDLSGTDWSLIPLERIERIEVVSGPRGSVLYGDNAAGGVINIITREGEALQARLSQTFGSYDTTRTSVGIGGSEGIVSYDISAGYLESDGYRDNSDIRARDFGGTVRIDPNNNISINFSGGYHKDDTRLPGSILQSEFDAGANRKQSFHPDDFADTDDYYFKSGMELFFLTQDTFRLDLSYRNRSVDQFATFADGWFGGDTQLETFSASPQFTFQEDFGAVSNRLVFGADFSRTTNEIQNTYDTSFGTSTNTYKLRRRTQGYFVQDDLGVTRNLTLSGGYRYDRARYAFQDGVPDRASMDEEAANFGINYNFGRAKVYASFGKTFRYPVLDELFSFFDNTVNSTLHPQTARNLETGTQFELLENLDFIFNLFSIKTYDEIYYNPFGGPFNYGANENLDGDTLREGVEARVRYRSNGWSTGAGFTFPDARIEGGQYNGSHIPNVPKHRATAHLGYTFDVGLFAGLEGIYIGSRYLIGDFTNVAVKQDNYTLVNAKLRYDWRWLTVFANLNNIFDEKYASYGGLNFLGQPGYYPSPRFNFLAGVTARFGGI
jgi:iron complex outermembrane recepter protein